MLISYVSSVGCDRFPSVFWKMFCQSCYKMNALLTGATRRLKTFTRKKFGHTQYTACSASVFRGHASIGICSCILTPTPDSWDVFSSLPKPKPNLNPRGHSPSQNALARQNTPASQTINHITSTFTRQELFESSPV